MVLHLLGAANFPKCALTWSPCAALTDKYNFSLRLTAGVNADWLLQPLLATRWQAKRHHHHRALGGPHQQKGADGAVRLPGETLAEVKGGDDLPRLPVYAGYAGAARAGEGVILGIWTVAVSTKMRRMRKRFFLKPHNNISEHAESQLLQPKAQ